MSEPKPGGDLGHDDVRRFYNDEYYGSQTRLARLPWHLRFVARRLGNLEGREVLDIACGAGEWLEEMSRRGARVAGVDISSRAVATSRAALSNAEIHEGVAEDLPFDDTRFDLVTCLGSLEHFLDQPAALGEMLRVSKQHAKYLILVPNAGFLTRRLGLYGGTDQVAVRETIRPLQEWQWMLERAGLKVCARWRDLHPLSGAWIRAGAWYSWPVRAAQALALVVWPLAWQYQVYFLCTRSVKNPAAKQVAVTEAS